MPIRILTVCIHLKVYFVIQGKKYVSKLSSPESGSLTTLWSHVCVLQIPVCLPYIFAGQI